MIIGIGSDVVNISRIEAAILEHGDKFIQRIFTANEIAAAERISNPDKKIAHYAKRFAAKEAFSKAIGTGIGEVNFKHIGVLNDEKGKPYIEVVENAKHALDKITPTGHKAVCHISLSDDEPVAQAMIVIFAISDSVNA